MSDKTCTTDVLIIGASASGLMCAIEAGRRGRKVIVLDHANRAGKKILMSGGGRCNFTNMDIDAANFISHNKHFCKSALSRYTQWDFIAMVNAHGIPYHERDLGKLFCDDSAKDILNMLLEECSNATVKIQLNCDIDDIEKNADGLFSINTSSGYFQTASLVIASGGLRVGAGNRYRHRDCPEPDQAKSIATGHLKKLGSGHRTPLLRICCNRSARLRFRTLVCIGNISSKAIIYQ